MGVVFSACFFDVSASAGLDATRLLITCEKEIRIYWIASAEQKFVDNRFLEG